jgi:hypothetical protein
MEDVMRMLAALLSFAFTSAALAAAPASAQTGGMIGVPGASAPAPDAAEAPYGKPSGLLPGMVIGPKLAILPVPAVYGLGLEAKFGNLVGVSLDYSAWPNLKSGDVTLGYDDISVAARLFPWRGRFYLGAALGQRSFFAKGVEATTGQTVKVDVKSTYLAPEIGWRFVWTSGFFMGIDLGYQIVLSPKTTLSVPAAAAVADPGLKKDVEDAGDNLGKIGFPIISLLQLGFYL